MERSAPSCSNGFGEPPKPTGQRRVLLEGFRVCNRQPVKPRVQ